MRRLPIMGCGAVALRVVRLLYGLYRGFALSRSAARFGSPREHGIVPVHWDLYDPAPLARLSKVPHHELPNWCHRPAWARAILVPPFWFVPSGGAGAYHSVWRASVPAAFTGITRERSKMSVLFCARKPRGSGQAERMLRACGQEGEVADCGARHGSGGYIAVVTKRVPRS